MKHTHLKFCDYGKKKRENNHANQGGEKFVSKTSSSSNSLVDLILWKKLYKSCSSLISEPNFLPIPFSKAKVF